MEKSEKFFVDGTPKIDTSYLSNLLWSFIIFFVGSGVSTLTYSIIFKAYWLIPFSGISLLGYFIYKGYKETPAKPLTYKVITWWGKLTGEYKREGKDLFADYFPFFYSFTPVEMTQIDGEFEFKNTRCKVRMVMEEENTKTEEGKEEIRSGGSVDGYVSITIEPDKNRLPMLIKNGGIEGVKKRLKSMIGEDFRQMCRDNTWEQMIFASDLLSAQLIVKIIGENLKGEMSDNDFKSLKQLLDSKEDNLESQTEARKILQDALSNGIADAMYLGVIIRRVNVDRIDEELDLQEAASALAKQILKRRARNYELNTEVAMAGKLFKLYEDKRQKVSMLECVKEIRMRDNIDNKQGMAYEITIPGLKETLGKFLGGKLV